MENSYNKTVVIGLFIGGIIFMIMGSTFAYLAATGANNQNGISGSTLNFSTTMTITTLKSGNMIPVDDSLIDDTLNSVNQCIDVRNNRICSLYQVTLTNSGNAVDVTGYLKTVSNGYTSGNLKYQLFSYANSTYTAATDIKTVPTSANGTSNFTLNNNAISISLSEGTASNYSANYYLAIWISDTGGNQTGDINKSYSGSLVFTSTSGNTISASFS